MGRSFQLFKWFSVFRLTTTTTIGTRTWLSWRPRYIDIHVVCFEPTWLTELENPIWTFAKKWNLKNTYSNYSSILTYDETGYNDYASLLDDFENLYEGASEQAGILLKENLQDQTARTGLALAGWRPKIDDMKAQAVEWWEWGKYPSSNPVSSSNIT